MFVLKTTTILFPTPHGLNGSVEGFALSVVLVCGMLLKKLVAGELGTRGQDALRKTRGLER